MSCAPFSFPLLSSFLKVPWRHFPSSSFWRDIAGFLLHFAGLGLHALLSPSPTLWALWKNNYYNIIVLYCQFWHLLNFGISCFFSSVLSPPSPHDVALPKGLMLLVKLGWESVEGFKSMYPSVNLPLCNGFPWICTNNFSNASPRREREQGGCIWRE